MKNRLQKFVVGTVAAAIAFQIYFVRELLATLILIGVVFAAFASLVLALKILHWMYERTFTRAEAYIRSDFRNKPFRRLRSQTAR